MKLKKGGTQHSRGNDRNAFSFFPFSRFPYTCLCSGSDFESRHYRILNCHHRYCRSHHPRLDISCKRKQSTLRVDLQHPIPWSSSYSNSPLIWGGLISAFILLWPHADHPPRIVHGQSRAIRLSLMRCVHINGIDKISQMHGHIAHVEEQGTSMPAS
jgi:hypothetical protein